MSILPEDDGGESANTPASAAPPASIGEAPSGKPGDYMVVARRYRPLSFDQLVGQQQVSQALANAITSNRVGHAYLFTGARGVGKTSSARILAKALNCVHGPTPSPCNQCDTCQAITAGNDMDVLEFDGASNRGIDEIRQLRSNVNVRPSRSRYKIYIIDEVHMLTTPAFNALLKTLEEPPEHVKFIFCTTDPEKIPITVLSRCQRFDFSGIRVDAIQNRLAQICENEGVTADEEALALLARRAAGSMRDSQSLLEQLLSHGKKNITAADVHTMLGTVGRSKLTSLVAKLIERNPPGALQELDASLAAGVDEGQLIDQLVEYYRDLMAAAVDSPTEVLLSTPPAEVEGLRASSKQLGLQTILAALQILDQTAARMRQSTHGRTLAEIAVVRIASLDDLDDLAQLVAQLQQGGPPAVAPRTGGSPTSAPAQRPGTTGSAAAMPPRPGPNASATTAPMVEPSTRSTSTSAVGSIPPIAYSSVATSNSANGPTANLAETRDGVASRLAEEAISAENIPAKNGRPLNASTVKEIWQTALDKMGDLTADCCSHADSIAISGPNRLVVTFKANYNSSKLHCERPDRKARLEQTLAEIVGQPVRVELAVSSSPADSQPQLRQQVSARQRTRDIQSHPLVAEAMRVLDAEVLDVELPRTAATAASE